MNPALCVGFTYYNEKEMLTQAILSLAHQGTDNLEMTFPRNFVCQAWRNITSTWKEER